MRALGTSPRDDPCWARSPSRRISSFAYRVALGRHHVPGTRSHGRTKAYPRLGERRDQLAGTLSGGEQRMLAVARVLSVPMKLLIVDELSLGLSPSVVDDVYDHAGPGPRAGDGAAAHRTARRAASSSSSSAPSCCRTAPSSSKGRQPTRDRGRVRRALDALRAIRGARRHRSPGRCDRRSNRRSLGSEARAFPTGTTG